MRVQKKKENAIARIREDAEAKREDGSVFFQGQKRKKLWKKASLMVAAALAIFVIDPRRMSNAYIGNITTEKRPEETALRSPFGR